jgi:hypothetical protein
MRKERMCVRWEERRESEEGGREREIEKRE